MMGAVISWVFNRDTTPAPDELVTARICEYFHIGIDDYERHSLRYQAWYAQCKTQDMAERMKDRMAEKNFQPTDDEQTWLAEWDEYLGTVVVIGKPVE